MARDAALLSVRNQEILAEYKRLSSCKYPVKSGLKTINIYLTYGQKLAVLAQCFFLSVRTLEGIITEPQEGPAAPGRSAAA